MGRSKGRIYVTTDYYGGYRLSSIEINATNIDGSDSIFENTGRGAGDLSKEDAEHLVECWNSYEEGGLVEQLQQQRDDLGVQLRSEKHIVGQRDKLIAELNRTNKELRNGLALLHQRGIGKL